MNLLFSIDRKFVPLLLNCVNSIVKNGSMEDYAAYILHSDLEPEDMSRIQDTAGPQVEFHFISVPPGLFEGFPVSRRYPQQIYYRLAAPLLLPSKLERILYLDVDTVVINPLTEVETMPFDGAYFMACTHVKKMLTKLNQTRLDMEAEAPYINSGVMMLNLPLFREHLDLGEIRTFANEKKHSLFLPDQDILTALYGNHVKLLDSLRYNLSDRVLALHNANPKNDKIGLDWVRDNSVVIHYCGKNKPWNVGYTGTLGIFYQESDTSTATKRLFMDGSMPQEESFGLSLK